MGAELRGVLTGFALVAAGVLLLARIDLGIPGQPLVQSLQLHLAAALLGLALALGLARARWRAVLVVGLALSAAFHVALRINAQQAAREPLAAMERVGAISVLSFNVLHGNAEREALARYIIGSGADVAVILEARPIYSELAAIEEVYPYRIGCSAPNVCDLALFSRTPLRDGQVRSLGTLFSNRLIMAHTEIDGQPLALVAAHLSKPYFDRAGAQEAERLKGWLQDMEGPLVLAGDFNSAPWADSIHSLVEDADLVPPPWHHSTWPVDLGPLGVPIDHIFTRAPLVIEAVETTPGPIGSNHLGLLARIAVTAR